MAEFLIDMPAAFGLHKSMWTTTIRNQGTEEQHRMFLEPSLKYEIIGSEQLLSPFWVLLIIARHVRSGATRKPNWLTAAMYKV